VPTDISIQEAAAKGIRTTLVGIIVNTLLAGIKAIAGILGNSYALIADAIESTTDIVSSLIVWSGLKISSLPPDEDHPYGHGKAEPLAAVVVSLTLVVAAIAIAIQSIREIVTPHHAPAPFTLIVLILVVITKELLFRFVFDVGKSVNSTAVKTDAWHHRSDAITSAAAFVGISVALIGGAGYESADDWAAMLAALIIAINAYRMFRPAMNEIMDAAPSDDIEMNLRNVAHKVDGVIDLEKCFIRKMGFSYYVDLHVTVDGTISVRDGHTIARNVREVIRTSNTSIAEVLIHIEPHDLLHE
jgi:cation diffusion facilitator family transporter